MNLVEKSYPELIPHLSSCKSPQVNPPINQAPARIITATIVVSQIH